MTTHTRRSFLLLLTLCLGFVACGRTLFFPRQQKCVFDSDCSDGLRCVNQICREFELPDGGPTVQRKRFGEPCDGGAECQSDFCVGSPRGAVCTEACDAGDACPTAWACKSFGIPDGGVAAQTLCALEQPLLCQDCADDLACGASGADKCIAQDGGAFCGRDCTFLACPALYACLDFGSGVRQCVPEGKTCDCVPETLGLMKGCRGGPNAFGACPGSQVCQVDGGFTACDAPPALQETCNGVDDDCNLVVDDLVAPTCTKTKNGRTCTGPQLCMGTAGLFCNATEPGDEVCNYEDDDCNGTVDDGFVDAQKRYTTLAHCGACNNDCQRSIANALTTTCELGVDGKPRCRALTCRPGFFPFADGTVCLEVPNTLCRPCAQDTDCVSPGARCITVDGAKVCGRECGGASACPSGYACGAADGGSQQCRPVTGTCTCATQTLGAVRSCVRDVCRGVESCGPGPQGPAWSACDVDSFNPEICDGRDNNCNNQIDEGFRNQATGRYDTVGHCGFCNNDCTKYFSPTLQHTTGVCDTAPALPRCGMGPCLTEVVGGTTFEWVNVNGSTDDGCECRRVQGNTTIDLPDRAPATGNAASWVDENCDGVDGVATDAIFVSATAAAGGNGSRTAPFITVAQGLAAQQSQGKRYVLVAQGLYRENVRLFEGAQVFGGYSSDFLKRDPRLHTTFLQGVAPTATAIAAVHAESVGIGAGETVVAGFTIVGHDVAAALGSGEAATASIGVYCRDCGPRFVLMTNDILGGRGGRGGPGSTGTQGFGRQVSTAVNGGNGRDSRNFPGGICASTNHQAGGLGGSNGACATANATSGGSVVCPVYDMPTTQGAQQQYVMLPPASREGRGGWDWSYDSASGFSCGHVTESGFPSNIQSHDGADGVGSPDGPGGNGGAGAPSVARYGSFTAGRWTASPSRSLAGTAGALAQGGGGGGAGGGVARFIAGGCNRWEIGATGGGGGAGGCGGTGGVGGGAGGASIGILLASSGAVLGNPTIRGNRLQRGLGGDGGNGGFGGAGGQGGAGGFGGNADRWSSSTGGKGGNGGNGGPGGGGGGGAGGPSFSVLGFNQDVASLSALNTFLVASTVDTGGRGGAGGSSPGPVSSTGLLGVAGASSDLVTLRSCSPGCTSGFTCDANSVCVPN